VDPDIALIRGFPVPFELTTISAVELTSVIDLLSKFSPGAVNSVTSGLQSKGDAAHTSSIEDTYSEHANLDWN